MRLTRFPKLFSAVALFGGLLALTAPDAVFAANKVQEAKRYTHMLKLSKAPKDKVMALNELGDLGRLMKALVTDALPDMRAALKDKDASVRAAAATAIGKASPDKESIDALVDLLKNDKDETVKIAAARGLAAAGPNAKAALPALREINKNTDEKSKLNRAARDASRSINAKRN